VETLEKRKEDILIEILQQKIHCSREEARIILHNHQYDIVSAIEDFNKLTDNKYVEEVIHVRGKHFKSTLKKLLRQTNLVHITITKNHKDLLSVPVTLGMVTFFLYPLISSLSMVFLLKNEFTIKILKLNN